MHVFIQKDELFQNIHGEPVGPMYVVFDRVRPITHIITDDIALARRIASATGLILADTTGEPE